MTYEEHRQVQHQVGPIWAVATVPAEFLSSAIFELVQGAYRLAERVGHVAGGLRRR